MFSCCHHDRPLCIWCFERPVKCFLLLGQWQMRMLLHCFLALLVYQSCVTGCCQWPCCSRLICWLIVGLLTVFTGRCLLSPVCFASAPPLAVQHLQMSMAVCCTLCKALSVASAWLAVAALSSSIFFS